MIICTRCGAENSDGSKHCAECQAFLPQIPAVPEEIGPPAKVEARLNVITENTYKVKNGEWSIDQYAEFLEELAWVLAEKEQEIRDVEIPEESYDDFVEELEVGFNGIALYNEGIAHLMLYVEEQNPEHLDYGLDLIKEGNESINEAMKINRENRRKIEEMQIDTTQMI